MRARPPAPRNTRGGMFGLGAPPGGIHLPDTLNGPPKPFGPTAPTAKQTAPTNSATTQTQPSPLDSTYFANVGQHQFDVNNRVNALNQASGYAGTDLQNQLAQLARQQPLDQLKTSQAANGRGALFSTVLGQQLGDVNRGYLDRESGLQDTFARQQAARVAEAKALEEGVPIYNEGQRLQATERAAIAAQNNKALGELVKALAPKSPKPPATTKAGPRPDTLTGTRRLAGALTGRTRGGMFGKGAPRQIHIPGTV